MTGFYTVCIDSTFIEDSHGSAVYWSPDVPNQDELRIGTFRSLVAGSMVVFSRTEGIAIDSCRELITIPLMIGI